MTKRPLHINAQYIITLPFGPTEPSLRGHRIRILVQHPDLHLPPRVVAAEGIMQTGRWLGERLYIQAQLQRYDKERPTCRCKAYPWPHHKGYGACWANNPGPFCTQCGRPAATIEGESLCCLAPLAGDAELETEFNQGD